VKTRATRDVSGNPITRFLSDTAMNVASKLVKVASSRALMYEVYDWDEEFDSIKFYEDVENLQKISELLDEAYEHYFSRLPNATAKGSDGSVTVKFGTHFERKDIGIKITKVTIFSYIFYKERSIDFDTTEEALSEVRKWHAKEMGLSND
jgi:membrane-bound lytic murein transglycosylase